MYRNGTAEGITYNMTYLDTKPGASNVPTILAAHGAPGTYNDYSELIEKLSGKGYRVIAPNLPDMKLTDETRTFYHSPEERYELLSDFLAAINVSNLDLAFMHSGATYAVTKLWNDTPGFVKSLVWINPTGHRRPRSMRPVWFADSVATVNMFPLGRQLYRNLGFVFSKITKVRAQSPEDLDNAALSCLTLYTVFRGDNRLPDYVAKVAETKTPFSFFYSDRDKLVEKEIFQELVQMLGATPQNVNIASQGAIVKAAEKELDWLRIFNMQDGGHYAFRHNFALLDQEITRLVEKVRSA